MSKPIVRKSIKIDPEVHARAKERARSEGRHLEVVIDRLIKKGLAVTAEEKE